MNVYALIFIPMVLALAAFALASVPLASDAGDASAPAAS